MHEPVHPLAHLTDKELARRLTVARDDDIALFKEAAGRFDRLLQERDEAWDEVSACGPVPA